MATENKAVTDEGTAPRMVTLAKGGTAQRTVAIQSLRIPSLWHIALRQNSDMDRAAILEVWHIAHDLRREILEEGK